MIIDLSQWNVVEDWDAVKSAVDGVILRCGYTLSTQKDLTICVDHKYAAYRAACQARGIPFSLYYFTNAITPSEAEIEASYVAGECRDIPGYILPVFVDTERVSGSGRADNLDKDQRTRCIDAFCSALQRQGVPAGIYASDSWMSEQLDLNRLPFSLWVAAWGADRPKHDDYVLWQYTSSGSVPGISGRVDLSTRERTWLTPVERITDLMTREVGYLEKADGNLAYLYNKKLNAGMSNYTKYGYEMRQLPHMDYPAPWCATFVSWAFTQILGLDGAKKALWGDIDDYCPAMVNRAKKAGKWVAKPKAGDLVFFGKDGGDHVGYVYQVSAGYIHTIEGNTSSSSGVDANGGGVWAKSYTIGHSRIAGYARPIYN